MVQSDGEDGPPLYIVERILDYQLQQDLNKPGCDNYDKTLGDTRWELRYLVKWHGYGAEDNSWEPRSCFMTWDDNYDQQLRAIQSKDKKKPSPQSLIAEADKRNKVERQKVKTKQQEKRLATREKNKKAKERESAKSVAPAVQPKAVAPKTRGTRNSINDVDAKSLNDFLSTNAPAAVRNLALDVVHRDANGEIVYSSSASESQDRKPDLKPDISELRKSPPTTATPVADLDLGFADSDSDDEVAPVPVCVPPPPPSQPLAGQGGFAEDSDEEMAPASRPVSTTPHAAPSAGDEGGFADSDSDDHATPAAPPAAPKPSTAGADGFADSDSDDSPQRQSAPRPAGDGQVDGLGFAESDSDSDSDNAPIAASFVKKKPAVKEKPKEKPKETIKEKRVPQKVQASAPAYPPPADRLKKPLPKTSVAEKKKVAPPPSKPTPAAAPPKKKKRIIVSDDDSDDIPLVPVPAPAKTGLAALKFKKKTSLPEAQPSPPPPPPPPPPAPAATPASTKPLPAPLAARGPSPLPPPVVQPSRAPSVSVYDATRDPRRRPGSIGADGRSNSDRTSDSAKKTQTVDDPFNKGYVKPASVNGFITLNTSLLENALRASNFLTSTSSNESPDSRVRKKWGIGDAFENFHDFDAVMREGPEGLPRTAYIYAPQRDVVNSKEARMIKTDYQALQLVLSTIEGVKQAEALGEGTVSAVFVHVSEVDEIGKYPLRSKLAEMEHLRARQIGRNIFVLFGEREKVDGRRAFGEVDHSLGQRERIFRPFWSTTAAVTFTPAAFSLDSLKSTAMLTNWRQSLKRWPGQRDIFAWASVTYVLPEGPFDIPAKGSPALAALQSPNQEARRASIYDFHSAARSGLLELTREVPRVGPHPTPYFPASADRMHYSADEWGKVAQWLPSTVNFTSVEQLQGLVAVYRSQYLHIRRWIIVVTPEEQANATKVKLPGIDLLTLAQAEVQLGKDPFQGPH